MLKKECVYFIRQKGLSPVKIGYTSEPTPIKRLNSFETGSPYGIDLLGFVNVDSGLQLESKLHDFFKTKRVNNEWFDLTDNEVNLILFCFNTEKPITQQEDYNDFFYENLEYEKKIYNIDLYNLFNKPISKKRLMIELTKFCVIYDVDIIRGRDSRRWFILKQN